MEEHLKNHQALVLSHTVGRVHSSLRAKSLATCSLQAYRGECREGGTCGAGEGGWGLN